MYIRKTNYKVCRLWCKFVIWFLILIQACHMPSKQNLLRDCSFSTTPQGTAAQDSCWIWTDKKLKKTKKSMYQALIRSSVKKICWWFSTHWWRCGRGGRDVIIANIPWPEPKASSPTFSEEESASNIICHERLEKLPFDISKHQATIKTHSRSWNRQHNLVVGQVAVHIRIKTTVW